MQEDYDIHMEHIRCMRRNRRGRERDEREKRRTERDIRELREMRVRRLLREEAEQQLREAQQQAQQQVQQQPLQQQQEQRFKGHTIKNAKIGSLNSTMQCWYTTPAVLSKVELTGSLCHSGTASTTSSKFSAQTHMKLGKKVAEKPKYQLTA